MKRVVLVSIAILFGALSKVQAPAKTVLPEACGDPKVKFDVSTEMVKSHPLSVGAATALVVFIETAEDINISCILCNPTTRVGVDGAWVGANKGTSYFTYPISPGEHHLCVNWQPPVGSPRTVVGLNLFTATAGKVYYFQAKVTLNGSAPGGTGGTIELAPLNEDEGKYLVENYWLATATRQ
jgi:hypothetical protein